jgi:GDP-L-fucose synthase
MNDYFNEVAGHVIPSMIRKFDSAINSGASKITLLGTGQAIREFLYVDDLSRAIFIALRDYDDDIPINVGSGEEIKIENLAMKIGQKMGFKGEIEWNGDSPDGTLRKLLDSTKILSLGWKPLVKLDDGLDQVIDWYVASKTNGTLRV